MKLMFGEWLPDLPHLNNQGSIVATNVVPAGSSYKPMPSLNVYSSALTARCQGFAYAKDADGLSYNFAGDATKLYLMSATAYSDVSKSGGYTTPTDSIWSFSQYGQRFMATNFGDAIQSYVFASSTAFADLSATAPRARYITQLNNFTLVGNTYDAVDGNVPHRIRWSALGDPTSWTVSAVTQADYEDLDSTKGWVQQVIGGEYGVVFQERAISVVNYVGSPQVFQIREIESGRGLLAPGAAVKFGNFIAYLGIDGFYIFDGNQSVPIGENKINKTFFDDLDMTYLDRISAMADLDAQVIYWSYPGSGNTSGRCNRLLAYNYSPNAKMRWSYCDNVQAERIGISISEGYTMDSLDSLSGDLDALDAIVGNLDSRALTGNNYILSAFNGDHKLALFTGTAMDATIETMEGQLFEGKRGLVTVVRPLVEGTTATTTIALGSRNNLNESVTYTGSLSANSIGEYNYRTNARYHRGKLTITGGFDHAFGIEVLSAVPQGKR